MSAGDHIPTVASISVAAPIQFSFTGGLMMEAASSTATSNRGKVYVGQKCKRGVVGSKNPIIPGVKNINATSGSMNKIGFYPAKSFSPMLLGPVIEGDIFGKGDQVAKNMENYWQYGKIFRELGHVDTDGVITSTWYSFREKGYTKDRGDRHPIGTKSNEIKYSDAKGRNWYRYYTAISSLYVGEVMDYLTSRKRIYIPVYAHLVQLTPAFIELKKQVDAGQDVQILDMDVLPGSHEVTLDFLKERVNDPSHPFGHGYVLAALLAGIEINDLL